MKNTAKTTSNSDIRRILSIDGGGIKGVFPAAFLAAIEDDIECPIGSYFDLIVGTSTGGIISAGLALGFEAKKILEVYATNGPLIFSRRKYYGIKKYFNIQILLNSLFKSKYDSENLAKTIDNLIGIAKIGDSRTRLLIPAWDQNQRSVYIFKTAHDKRFSTDYNKPMKDALMATSAAPSYFPIHRAIDQVEFLDGSIWANNPIAVGVVEAIAVLKWKPSKIQVLSLGCSEEVYLLRDEFGKYDFKKFGLNLIFDGQSECALNMSKLLLGIDQHKKRIHRYSPQVPKDYFSMDDSTKVGKLVGIGTSSARNAKTELIPLFFGTPAKPFKPYYTLKENENAR